MKSLHIEYSYNIWSIKRMHQHIQFTSLMWYKTKEADKLLNRSYRGMYIEWYLHNIGYWLTVPFMKYTKIAQLNLRFKHLDLEEH